MPLAQYPENNCADFNSKTPTSIKEKIGVRPHFRYIKWVLNNSLGNLPIPS
jgi:hypothetical protein